MKKALSILLAVLMTVSLLSLPAAAAEDYTGKTVILYTGNLRGDIDIYPQIAAAKEAYEAKGAEVILVDAGNYLQGSAAANADMGLSVYNLMDAAGYDVAAMGVSEFVWTGATTGYPYHGNVHRYYTQAMLQKGTEELTYNVNRDGSQTATLPAKEPAKFRTVSANVEAGAEYDFEQSAEIITDAGLKLEFYGVTDPAVAELVQDGFVTVKETLPELGAPDADLVIRLTDAPDTGTEGAGLVIEAPYGGEAVTGAWVIDNETLELTREEVDLTHSHEAVYGLAADIREKSPEVLGRSEVILNGADSVNWNGESNLGDLVTDALLWYAENYIDGIDASLPLVAIQNGGNCDNFIYTGDITELDLLRALPFSPMGVGVLELTGAELLETLEAATQSADCPGFAQVAGLSYTLNLREDYDAGAAYGKFFEADSVNRVTITQVNGAEFDPEATYALVADNYVLNGNDTYYTLKNAKDAGAKYINNGSGVKTRDIVAMYIDRVLEGVIGEKYAASQGRITVDDSAFTDVKPGAYYADAVAWAVEEEITRGTSATEFSPENPCTRGQIVTFLYRLAGSPELEEAENPFTDVTEDSAYYSAILWAYANKITTGDTETTFSPDRKITRAEAVTFLYRFALEQGADVSVGEGTNILSYDDALEVPEYAMAAFQWGCGSGVMQGTTASTLSPRNDCTRGQIVTFLYRLSKL